jgi:hypothetical protein
LIKSAMRCTTAGRPAGASGERAEASIRCGLAGRLVGMGGGAPGFAPLKARKHVDRAGIVLHSADRLAVAEVARRAGSAGRRCSGGNGWSPKKR